MLADQGSITESSFHTCRCKGVSERNELTPCKFYYNTQVLALSSLESQLYSSSLCTQSIPLTNDIPILDCHSDRLLYGLIDTLRLSIDCKQPLLQVL